jgi:hypothetical protein
LHRLPRCKQGEQAEAVEQAQLRGVEVGLFVQRHAGHQRRTQAAGKGCVEAAHARAAGTGMGHQLGRAVAQRADDANARDRHAPHAAREIRCSPAAGTARN